MNLYPNVLLLGNGINRALGGGSWDALLETIRTNPRIPPEYKYKMPYPLQAILVSEDRLDQSLKKGTNLLEQKDLNPELTQVLQSLLACGFDHILTTNYTYELESAAAGGRAVSKTKLERSARHTGAVNRVEAKALCHSYQEVWYGGVENRVWHIHGEVRKPDSMILGHYYYAQLLQKMCAYVSKEKNRYQMELEEGKIRIESWMDAFIMGNIYLLGFGMEFSEFDLWWLLNRKKRENAPHGTTILYMPRETEQDMYDEKADLLRIMGVEVRDCGMVIPKSDSKTDEEKDEKNRLYREFYRRAIAEIQEEL